MKFVKEQDFGHDPIKVRDSSHYYLEHTQTLAEKWDELIDWERRAEGEGSFYIDTLKEKGKNRILDVSTGTGYDSVRLLKAGFDVTSLDGSPYMLAKAFENAKRYGFVMKTVQSDWRCLSRHVQGRYDAIICLGNSFTFLHDERDRRKTLAEFYSVLEYDGVLILDQRNYDYMLDKGFKTKHKYVYCGENVTAEPAYLDEGLARFVYSFPDNTKFYLNMCPIRKNYVVDMMLDMGFSKVDTYGDFKEEFHDDDPDFFIHVAEKYDNSFDK